MIIGLLFLLALNFLGIWVVRTFNFVVPGSVMGILFLLLLLCLFPALEKYFLRLTGFISRHLALFFIPVGVGIIQYGNLIQNQGWQLFLILAFSLFLTLGVTAWLFQFFLHRSSDEDFRD